MAGTWEARSSWGQHSATSGHAGDVWKPYLEQILKMGE